MSQPVPFRKLMLAFLVVPALVACSSEDGGGGGTGANTGTGGTAQGATGGGGTAQGATGGTGAQAGQGGSATGGAGGAVGAGEPASLAGITQLHNEARAKEGVPPLTWDPALAAIAQGWADGCVDNEAPIGLIDHNAGRSDNYPGYVGENIYGASGTGTPQAAVSLWMAEEADYDYASGKCAAGKACGHYTQVMWAATTKLGCGINKCAGLKFGGVIVCDYAPGGNSGGKPF